jgi:hypothetical protein
MARRAKRRCIRKKTITVLQSHGPAKKMRVCALYGHHYCVFKGKRKGVRTSCHTNKRAAKHAAAKLRKTCRARIRVRRVRAA